MWLINFHKAGALENVSILLQIYIVLYRHRRKEIPYLEALGIQINPPKTRVNQSLVGPVQKSGAQKSVTEDKIGKKLRELN